MSRQWRIEFPDAMYHVMSRGNEGRCIFKSDSDRHRFIEKLKLMSDRFQIEIYAWVLMSNHYHLLLRTRESNLSNAMQWFGAGYSRYFNLKNERQGHVFQGRFKSLLVENDQYMLQLSFYIHLNPIRSGLVKHLVDYPWSSYLDYISPDHDSGWLNTQLILSRFGAGNRKEKYKKAIQEFANIKDNYLENVRYGFAFGSKEFAQSLKENLKSSEISLEIPGQRKTSEEYDVDVLLRDAATVLDCNLEDFYRRKRIRGKDLQKRDALILLLWSTGVLKNKEIGDFFGVTYSAISRRISISERKLADDIEFQKTYAQIKSLIKM